MTPARFGNGDGTSLIGLRWTSTLNERAKRRTDQARPPPLTWAADPNSGLSKTPIQCRHLRMYTRSNHTCVLRSVSRGFNCNRAGHRFCLNLPWGC